MLARRAQVLTQGQDLHADRPCLAQNRAHLVLGLAQAQHQPGLAEEPALAGMSKHRIKERGYLAWTRTSHARRGTVFQVVGEHIGPGVEHLIDRGQIASKVAGQGFQHEAGQRCLTARMVAAQWAHPRRPGFVAASTLVNDGVVQAQARQARRATVVRLGGVRAIRGGRWERRRIGRTGCTRRPGLMMVKHRRLQHSPMLGHARAFTDGVQACACTRRAQVERWPLRWKPHANPRRMTGQTRPRPLDPSAPRAGGGIRVSTTRVMLRNLLGFVAAPQAETSRRRGASPLACR